MRGLEVDYRGHCVLSDVDLDLAAGEAVVVLGGSGSGKSTLLRALLGLVPAPGRVRAEELRLHTGDGSTDLATADGRRGARGRGIGLVFQDLALALSPLRRVGSLVAEANGDPTGVEDLLRGAGFPDPEPVAARRAHELSGGMAQRVGFALAVAADPPVLLADEPTTALDGPARDEVVRRLCERVAAGTGLLLVTHDVGVAAAVADRVVVLHQGRVVENGGVDEVLRTPTHEVTRSLVENVPWSLPARSTTRATPTGPPALRVDDLRARYRGAGDPVLDGLSLEIGAGEVVGVAGRSGGGKTTLLRCLLGLHRPDSGRLALDGMDPAEQGWQAVRRAVQVVPQDPRASLNPWRTAARLVTEPMVYHGIGDRVSRRARAAELLAEVGLDGLGDRRPGALSTGQCQRVAIARALAVRPRLLVADEPASALDATLQADVLRLLARVVAEHGMSALVVSHDLHVLERLCDRVAVIDGGRIVEDLPVGRLRAEATHPCSRALLDAHPVDPLDSGARRRRLENSPVRTAR
ncbi:ABC transporter ATP-binding protein [Pseudonocardia sp. RS010]|uniref:ABC transporter ATP-binding protein n=1 Tax=Pseudonocardia sp. RS010 TaxID=3385979 RepID=UPI0039A3265F